MIFSRKKRKEKNSSQIPVFNVDRKYRGNCPWLEIKILMLYFIIIRSYKGNPIEIKASILDVKLLRLINCHIECLVTWQVSDKVYNNLCDLEQLKGSHRRKRNGDLAEPRFIWLRTLWNLREKQTAHELCPVVSCLCSVTS